MPSSFNAISELPSFPLVSDQCCIIGNVTIHPNTAIAPGVVIQTTSHSQVMIEEGVCIGMGVVIKADQGTIVIERGAVLGARVLIIGQGRIGNHACIGASTTIFNSSVASLTVINAYSVIGDYSRFVETQLPAIIENQPLKEELTNQIYEPLKDPWDEQLNDQLSGQLNQELELELNEQLINQTESKQITESVAENHQEIIEERLEEQPSKIEEVLTENEPSLTQEVEPEIINVSQDLAQDLSPEIKTPVTKAPVVGQVYINNLLLTLFPNRQSTNLSSNQD